MSSWPSPSVSISTVRPSRRGTSSSTFYIKFAGSVSFYIDRLPCHVYIYIYIYICISLYTSDPAPTPLANASDHHHRQGVSGPLRAQSAQMILFRARSRLITAIDWAWGWSKSLHRKIHLRFDGQAWPSDHPGRECPTIPSEAVARNAPFFRMAGHLVIA